MSGRLAEAELYIVQGLETRRRIYAPDHWGILRYETILIELYLSTGREAEARPFIDDVLANNRRAASGPDAAAEMKHEYGRTLLRFNRGDPSSRETALQYLLEANEMDEFGNPDHLDTLTIAYQVTGQLDKAVDNQRRSVGLMDEHVPPTLRQKLEGRLEEIEAELAARQETAR